MLDKRASSPCPREDQIVSYLYRELTPVETERFEAHLAACTSCVDDLAELSEPHLAVYEWRTNIFDKIPAPSIELPFEAKQLQNSEDLLGRLTALLAGWPAGLRVGVAFAAVLIIGISAFLLTRPFAGTEVARNVEVAKADPTDLADERVLPLVGESPGVPAPSAVDGIVNKPLEPLRNTVRVKHGLAAARKPATGRTSKPEYAANRTKKTTAPRSLRLNNFDDDEDTTLRLADLLEEVGSL